MCIYCFKQNPERRILSIINYILITSYIEIYISYKQIKIPLISKLFTKKFTNIQINHILQWWSILKH